MSLTEISIKRPTLIVVIFSVLTLMGIVSYFSIGYELLPKMSKQIITISTKYPGAAPSEVENSVTKDIEDAVSSLAYALDTVFSHGAQEAMWAASRARDALFAYITERFDLDAGTQHGRSLITSFSIMQAELARQQADLTELHAAVKHPGSEAAVINKIKRRAERDAASFFG